MRALWAAAAAFAAAAALVAPSSAAARQGAGAGEGEPADSRAAVVVDLGDGEVRTACVLFRGPSVSGLDVLRAADMQPVVRAYAGEGGAVCKLCGVGCSAGSDCLTCQAPRYWQYWRSDGGDFAYSQRGAGATTVTDGDVEGWSWSAERRPPPFRTVESVCGAGPVFRVAEARPPDTTTTAAATPTTVPAAAPTTSAAISAAPPRRAAAVAPTTTRAADAPVTSLAPPAAPALDSTSTTSTTSPSTEPPGLAAGARPDQPDRGGRGSSPAGFAAFAAVLAGLAVAAGRARRRSTNMPTGPPTG